MRQAERGAMLLNVLTKYSEGEEYLVFFLWKFASSFYYVFLELCANFSLAIPFFQLLG